MELEFIDSTMRVAVEIKIFSEDSRYDWRVMALGQILGFGTCKSRAEAIKEAKESMEYFTKRGKA